MNIYTVKVTLYGHDYIESPDCPIRWRRSGVYDIRVDYEQKVEAHIFATSKEQAIELAENYNYNHHRKVNMIIDEAVVDVIDKEFVDTDGDDPEVYEILINDAEVAA